MTIITTIIKILLTMLGMITLGIIIFFVFKIRFKKTYETHIKPKQKTEDELMKEEKLLKMKVRVAEQEAKLSEQKAKTSGFKQKGGGGAFDKFQDFATKLSKTRLAKGQFDEGFKKK